MEKQGCFYKKRIQISLVDILHNRVLHISYRKQMQILRPDIHYTLTLPGKYSSYLPTEVEMCRVENNNFGTKAVFWLRRPTNSTNIRGFWSKRTEYNNKKYYIPTRFILGSAVQQDRLRQQRQICHTCRTQCRIQGHNVGQLTQIYKKGKKFRTS